MTMTRRIRAALIHLGISAIVAGIAAAAMLGIWFPPPYVEAMGADGLILILVAVDVILGPLVTLIVFTPGKARHLLVFDLAVIAALQVAALSYGAFVISQARPVYMLFVRDRFEMTAADEIRDEELAKVRRAEFRALPHLRPRLAAAEMPTDPGEQMTLMMSAIQGVDLKTFPQLGRLRLRREMHALRAALRGRRMAVEAATAPAVGRAILGVALSLAGLRRTAKLVVFAGRAVLAVKVARIAVEFARGMGRAAARSRERNRTDVVRDPA